MLRPHTLHKRASCIFILLFLLSNQGESLPHKAHGGALYVDEGDSQRVLVLEGVKAGILGLLGMKKEPRLTHKASEEELRRMYTLYREKMREMRGNTSDTMRETMSTVLFPATVKTTQAPRWRENQHMKWYRAVFHKNPNIQAEVTLALAQLKISRQILNKSISAQPELRPGIEIRVNRKQLRNSPLFVNVSNSQDVMVDISPEVGKWMRNHRGHRLVVDVGIVVEDDTSSENPFFSLELDLKQAQRRRQPRSNKEDECDERGWCCRKSVIVSFKDIGWTDWVVAPAEYIMHFCDGSCPYNYKPASMHTQVKSRMHQITKGETPRPCCVPSTYEPMVLMHYDSRGKLRVTTIDDLIVTKCHCA